MTKIKKLAELEAKILADNVTPELSEQATQLVFGDGNPDANVVFIGEAPGKNEDLQGKPFVGAAGKFLNEMLESVGMKREDVYITNIVKYRPPNNRDPEPKENEAFWPYLLKQIAIIKPKIIATLGRHSGQVFLPNLHISADHGQPKRIKVRFTEMDLGGKRADGVQGVVEERTKTYENTTKGAPQSTTQKSAANLNSADSSADRQVEMTFVILPLYHPAAALYNGSLRETLLADFQNVPQLLQN